MAPSHRHRWLCGSLAVITCLALVAVAGVAAFPGRDGAIAFSSRGSIYLINANGSHRRPLTRSGQDDSDPAWSPSGQRIAFVRYGGKRGVYVANADGTRLRLLTSGGSPAWSPDGRRLAFAAPPAIEDPHSEIFVINADGRGRQRLTSNAAWDGEPAWSPDGSTIAFASDRGARNAPQIYLMNADGSGQRALTPLTTAPNEDTDPAWSPDGTRIVFKGGGGLFVLNVDGSGLRRLTFDWRDNRPAWSPDGRKIAYDKLRKRLHKDIWVITADGSRNMNLTHSTRASEQSPDWQPLRTR
jgi:TolB protein